MEERNREQRPPAEGVRIIGAEEAQAALDAGQAAGRRPDDELRFGDVPPAPQGPRPPHRFPLPDSVDPAEAVPRPPVATPVRSEERRGRHSAVRAVEPAPGIRRPGPGAEGDPARGELPDVGDRQLEGRPTVDPEPVSGADPVSSDPSRSDPSHSDPSHSDPSHSDPSHSDPSGSNPSQAGVGVGPAPRQDAKPAAELPGMPPARTPLEAWAEADPERWAAFAAGVDPERIESAHIESARIESGRSASGHAGFAAADTAEIPATHPTTGEQVQMEAGDQDPVRDPTQGERRPPDIPPPGFAAHEPAHGPEASEAARAAGRDPDSGPPPTPDGLGDPGFAADPEPSGDRITLTPSNGPELPPWTDPPTGEVPRILLDDPAVREDDASAWQELGSRGLRWRDEAGDWDDVEELQALGSEETRVGALDTTRTEHSDLYSFDEDFERLEEERSGSHPAISVAEAGEDIGATAASPPRTRQRRPAPPGRPAGPARRTGRPGQSRRIGPPGAGAGGRDLGTAGAVGAALVVILLALYAVGPIALLILSAVVIGAAAAEGFGMLQRAGFRPATLLGLVSSVAIVFAAYWKGVGALPLVVAVTFVALHAVVSPRDRRGSAAGQRGRHQPHVHLGRGARQLRRGHAAAHAGRGLFLGAVITAVGSDIVAYFVGSTMGTRPIAPEVSPGKTWEGAAAGFVAALVVGAIIGKTVTPWGGLKHGLLLGSDRRHRGPDRRSGRVDGQARPGHQGLGHHPARPWRSARPLRLDPARAACCLLLGRVHHILQVVRSPSASSALPARSAPRRSTSSGRSRPITGWWPSGRPPRSTPWWRRPSSFGPSKWRSPIRLGPRELARRVPAGTEVLSGPERSPPSPAAPTSSSTAWSVSPACR